MDNNKSEFELFEGRSLYLAYFVNVKNSKEIRQSLLAKQLDMGLINAQLIVDVFQIQAAAVRALSSEKNGKLSTNTLHSELVYALSASRNVTEAFRRFGIADDTENLVVAIFDASSEKIKQIYDMVDGDKHPVNDLGKDLSSIELKRIKKIYKLSEAELSVYPLLDCIVSRIAVKYCM